MIRWFAWGLHSHFDCWLFFLRCCKHPYVLWTYGKKRHLWNQNLVFDRRGKRRHVWELSFFSFLFSPQASKFASSSIWVEFSTIRCLPKKIQGCFTWSLTANEALSFQNSTVHSFSPPTRIILSNCEIHFGTWQGSSSADTEESFPFKLWGFLLARRILLCQVFPAPVWTLHTSQIENSFYNSKLSLKSGIIIHQHFIFILHICLLSLMVCSLEDLFRCQHEENADEDEKGMNTHGYVWLPFMIFFYEGYHSDTKQKSKCLTGSK